MNEVKNEKIKVNYNTEDKGFLVTKTKQFYTLQEAMEFIRMTNNTPGSNATLVCNS